MPYKRRNPCLKGISLNGGIRSVFSVSVQNINNDGFVTNRNYNLEPEQPKSDDKSYDSDFYTVALAYDRNTGEKVEMIKYHELLRYNWNWKLSLKVLNELRVYNTLTDQTKMLTLIDFMLVVKFMTPEDDYRKIFNCEFKDIYLVFERFGNDLRYILNSKEPPAAEIKTHQTQQWLLSELLSAVSSLHSQKLIHRNVRPSNVSVSLEKKILKLRSFGLSCALSSKFFLQGNTEDEEEGNMDDEEEGNTDDEKEITPIYTPPEIILRLGGASSPSVDVWGVGCIFAEILSGGGGSPLFFLPSGIKPTAFTKIGAIVGTLQLDGGSYLDNLSPSNPLAIDLLKKMLDLNPHTRISVEEAKQHPYFEKQELVVGGGSSSRPSAEADDEDMGVTVEQVTEPTAAAAGLGWVEVTEPDVHSLRKLFWNEMKTFEMKKRQTSELEMNTSEMKQQQDFEMMTSEMKQQHMMKLQQDFEMMKQQQYDQDFGLLS